MIKKTVAAFFCLLLAVIAIQPVRSTAYAASADNSIIDEVDIFGFVEPVVGEQPLTKYDLYVPDDAPYEIWNFSWGSDISSPDQLYDKDMLLLGSFRLNAKDDSMRFADNVTIRINGETAFINPSSVITLSDGYFLCFNTLFFDLRGEAFTDSLTVTDFTLPKVGDCPADYPDMSVPDGVPYYIDDVSWFVGNSYEKLSDDHIFGYNEYYAIIRLKRTTDDIYFSGNNEITVYSGDSAVRGNSHVDDNSTVTFTTDPFKLGELPEKIEINGFVEPKIGELPITAEDLSVPDDSVVTIESVTWRNTFTTKDMQPGERFTYGNSYEIHITVKTKDGYFLKAGYVPELIIDGEINGGDAVFKCTQSIKESTFTAISREYDLVQTIDHIDILGFSEPKIGALNTINISVPANSGYSIEDAYWGELSTDTVMPENTRFDDKKAYAMVIIVKLDKGCKGGDEATVDINGRADLVSSAYYINSSEEAINGLIYPNDYVLVTTAMYDFRTPVDSININGITLPEIGTPNSTRAYVPSGSEYKVTDAYWVWEKGDQYDKMTAGEKFTEDRLYYMIIDIQPAAGFTFDENTAVFINGKADLADLYYSTWNGSTFSLSTISFDYGSPAAGVRIAGSSRQATAAEISRMTYPNGTENVVLASGDDYADALAGVPLAYALDAPILLIRGKALDNITLNEIERLGAKNIYILGGKMAIGDNVEKILSSKGYNVYRIAGQNRFETSAAIADKLCEISGKPSEVFFAVSHNYPDALASSSVAAIKGVPILYIASNGSLTPSIERFLSSCGNLERAYILGGNTAIDKSADRNVGRYAATERIYGSDRYETCIAVNKKFNSCFNGQSICTATGLNYPDALAGGVFAAKNNMPLILCGNYLTSAQTAYIASLGDPEVYILGGKQAVSNAVVNMIEDLLIQSE